MLQFNGRWRAGLVAAAVVVGWTAAAAGPVPQREARERHAIVSVTDKNDKPVPGLTVKDFTVREDDVAREIMAVSPAAPPSHMVLLIDDSAVTQPLTIELRTGIKTFLRQFKEGGASTVIRVATFGDRPTTRAEFTTSLPLLTAAVDRVNPRPNAGAVLLEAIFESCRDLKKQAAVQPVIVAFVEEHGPEFSNETHKRVADALKEVSASLWTVVLQTQVPGGQDTSQEVRERTRLLSEVTVDSGGLNSTFLSRHGIEPAFAEVAVKLTNRYDVTFARPGSFTPPSRLNVELRDRSLKLAAPRWAAP